MDFETPSAWTQVHFTPANNAEASAEAALPAVNTVMPMIIRGVSLDIRDGERHAIIGPNGAGKTTTMRIITGYMPALQVSCALLKIESRSKVPRSRKMKSAVIANA